jgi:hypothetical protein
VWFRVDDNLHSHPKAIAAGNAAMGVWVRCGSYSSAYLLDGHVPRDIALSIGRSREADRLVEAGLWLPTDNGWLMPDFHDRNPTSDEVKAKREADAERKREARARAHLNAVNGRQVRDHIGQFGGNGGHA